jgi:IS6 family transposase
VDETYARIRGRRHYIYRAIDGHGQIVDAYVLPTRDTVAVRRFFERAVASSGTTPRRVITDKAARYPPALTVAVCGVLHRTERDRTNGIERDHGLLKERLRLVRGESSRSAAVLVVGHAPVRNVCRAVYSIAECPKRLMLACSWSRLAERSNPTGYKSPSTAT